MLYQTNKSDANTDLRQSVANIGLFCNICLYTFIYILYIYTLITYTLLYTMGGVITDAAGQVHHAAMSCTRLLSTCPGDNIFN